MIKVLIFLLSVSISLASIADTCESVLTVEVDSIYQIRRGDMFYLEDLKSQVKVIKINAKTKKVSVVDVHGKLHKLGAWHLSQELTKAKENGNQVTNSLDNLPVKAKKNSIKKSDIKRSVFIQRILYDVYIKSFKLEFKEEMDFFLEFKRLFSKEPEESHITIRRVQYKLFRDRKEKIEEAKAIIKGLKNLKKSKEKQGLILDRWYQDFELELEATILGLHSDPPEDFDGSVEEWNRLLDSIFISQAKFYSFASRSLKHYLSSTISDFRSMMNWHRANAFRRKMADREEVIMGGAAVFLGGVLFMFQNMSYQWVPQETAFTVAGASLFGHPMLLPYYSYLVTVPKTLYSKALFWKNRRASKKVLLHAAESTAHDLADHLLMNDLSHAKLEKLVAKNTALESLDLETLDISPSDWDEVRKIYNNAGRAIQFLSSSISAYMFYQTNPLKSYVGILKEQLEVSKKLDLKFSGLSDKEKNEVLKEIKKIKTVQANLSVLTSFVEKYLRLLENLQERISEIENPDQEIGEGAIVELAQHERLNHNFETKTSISKTILSLRGLLMMLDTYKESLVSHIAQSQSLESGEEEVFMISEQVELSILSLDKLFAEPKSEE